MLVSAQSDRARARPSLVPQYFGPIGAIGNPPRIVVNCSTVTTSLPLVPNSGMYEATVAAGSSAPLAMNGINVLDTNAFVAEKMQNRVSSSASPNDPLATISPPKPMANCAARTLPTSSSAAILASRRAMAAGSVEALMAVERR